MKKEWTQKAAHGYLRYRLLSLMLTLVLTLTLVPISSIAPEAGSSFDTISTKYISNLQDSTHVPAEIDDIISIVEVYDGNVVGYTTLAIDSEHIGTVPPMVELPYVHAGLQQINWK